MRKALLLFAAVCLIPILTLGQVYHYVFSQSMGTYIPISGGTVVASATASTNSGSMDDLIYNLPDGTIPFTFIFDGAGYTGLNISSNGFITFGSTAPLTTNYTPIANAGNYNGAIAAAGRDIQGGWVTTAGITSGSNIQVGVADNGPALVGNPIIGSGIPSGTVITGISGNNITMSANATSSSSAAPIFVVGSWSSISYQTLGSAPNRVFVIQFANFKRFGTTLSTVQHNKFNFQFRLHETSNKIEVVYGDCSPGLTTNTLGHQVGLRGPNNVFPANVHNRMNTKGVNDNWLNSSNGTANNSGMVFNSVDPANVIPNGLTYSWEVCTTNPSDGGQIAGSQTICSNTAPALFTSSSLPTGHFGNLEYKWQSTTSDPSDSGFDPNSWAGIASSNAATY